MECSLKSADRIGLVLGKKDRENNNNFACLICILLFSPPLFSL